MVVSLTLILILVGLVVWMVPSRFSEVGKWTFIIALAAFLLK